MMTIKAIPVNEENFKPFGTYTKVVKGEGRTGTGGWECWMTPGLCMEHPAGLGYTMVGGMPLEVDSMEVHNLTTEMLMCGDKPIVLAVADSDPHGTGAKAEDIRAFLISPGEIVVLKKGIWHDACRGADGDSYYYFMARNLEPAVFVPIIGEPVLVEL
ncbi:ureidoglycolate lyase [Clostridium sp. AM58-1XD]|uniref:ureidoglycolate lyase n=1 Tax=Clostridium sp. AM58-1XD TaxID=2292307 RepID=UPI0015F77757|nr:ureidoglycolate lyase [Clostridium sp. AM58-1XD]